MASKLLSDDFLNLICLDFSCQTAEEAIRQAGNLLLENQYLTRDYIDGHAEQRERTSNLSGLWRHDSSRYTRYFVLRASSRN